MMESGYAGSLAELSVKAHDNQKRIKVDFLDHGKVVLSIWR